MFVKGGVREEKKKGEKGGLPGGNASACSGKERVKADLRREGKGEKGTEKKRTLFTWSMTKEGRQDPAADL